MKELILTLMIWISSQTGFVLPEIPNIEVNTKIELRDVIYDCDNLKVKDREIFDNYCTVISKEVANLIGLYISESKTIHLPKYFDYNNSSHKSILLHELVHHLQYSNGIDKKVECQAMLEKQAYDLQDLWLKEHNIILEKDLEIGPFLRLWVTTCHELM